MLLAINNIAENILNGNSLSKHLLAAFLLHCYQHAVFLIYQARYKASRNNLSNISVTNIFVDNNVFLFFCI